ncbi:MAG: hypothetical protein EOM10_16340 [Opitutae bacterium]|nr:hypothetical protein [Opitutae bacterium]
MPDSHIAALLQRLEQHSQRHARQQTVNLPIDREDMVRLQALAEVYGMSVDDLLRHNLAAPGAEGEAAGRGRGLSVPVHGELRLEWAAGD